MPTRFVTLAIFVLAACGTSHDGFDGGAVPDAAPDGSAPPDVSTIPDGSAGLDAIVDAATPSACTGESLGGVGEGCFCQGPFARHPDGLAYRSGASLDVIDVSGGAPVLLGSVTQSHIGSEGAVTLDDDILYVGSWGIDVFDVSTPTDPRPIGGVDLEGAVTDLVVRGTTLWVGFEPFAEGSTASLDAYDISDPSAPSRFASLDLEGKPGSVLPFRTDGLVVLSSRRFGETGPDLVIRVDISTPSAPAIVTSLPLAGDTVLRRRGAIDGTLVHVVGTDPLVQSIELTEGRTVGTLPPPSDPGGGGLGISLSGSLAFVGAGGIQVVDLSPASAPRIIGTLASSGDPFYSLRDGEHLLVSNGNQLEVLSLDCM